MSSGREPVVEVEPAEPAERQPILDLLAQPPLRADAVAVADDEHADEQLGIDRRPAGVAVVVSELLAQIGERGRREHVDPAQQMIGWNTIFEMKLVEEPGLIRRLPPHHRQPPSLPGRRNHCSLAPSTDFFNTIGPKRTCPHVRYLPAFEGEADIGRQRRTTTSFEHAP